MTAPSAGQPSAEAVSVADVAMQEVLVGDAPVSYSRLAEAALAAAWPLLRAQVIAECVAVAEESAADDGSAVGVANRLRALLAAPPADREKGGTDGPEIA